MATGDDSVIGGMEGFHWSSAEAVAYEAAIEAINGAVGAYSARIAAEEARPEPDHAAIDALRTARGALAQEREQLDPTYHAGIAEARARFTELAVAVREGRV